jgi:hypothetical protein
MQEALSRVLFALALLGGSGRAAAAECGANKPWVLVDVPEAVGSVAVLSQLRVGLDARGIDACAPGAHARTEPIARVALKAPESKRVAIDVVAEDALTAKRVSRELDLAALPRDAWPLAIALAIDEILRASWAELALESAPPPKRPVPIEVRDTVRDSLAPEPLERSAPAMALGTAIVGEAFSGGQRHIGVDARAGVWLLPRLALSVLLGLRDGLSVSAERGEITSTVLVGGLGLAFTPTEPAADLGVDLLSRVEASRIEFQAEAERGATGSRDAAVAVVAEAGAGAWWSPAERLRVGAEVLGGVPLVAVSATEDGAPVAGASGAAVSVAASLMGVF